MKPRFRYFQLVLLAGKDIKTSFYHRSAKKRIRLAAWGKFKFWSVCIDIGPYVCILHSNNCVHSYTIYKTLFIN